MRPGRIRITIDYTGNLSRVLTDSSFHQQDKGAWYTFTKFEPTLARRTFPCFDEPSSKTPWQLTLRVPSGLQAFSNSPVQSELDEGDGTKSVRFARSKPLPTYLVAFAVGPVEAVDAGLVGRNKLPARIIVPHGRADEVAFAAENSARAVQLLEAGEGFAAWISSKPVNLWRPEWKAEIYAVVRANTAKTSDAPVSSRLNLGCGCS